MLAAIGSTPYKIVLLLHILGAIVAFGAAFVNPTILRLSQRDGAGGVVAKNQATAATRVSLPAMILTGLLGFGVAGMSKPDAIAGAPDPKPIYSMSQPWLMTAVLLWLVLVAIYFFAILPALRKIGEGDEGATKIVSALTGVSHLILVVMLYLMIFKPGL